MEVDVILESTGAAPRPPHPTLGDAPIRTQRTDSLSFFLFHFPIRAKIHVKKILKKQKKKKKKKKKKNLELISYLVINLLYIFQIICKLNNLY